MGLQQIVDVYEKFGNVGTQTLDSKNRITIGDSIRHLFPDSNRIQVFTNTETGDVLLRPVIEIPAYEAWVFNDKKALTSIKKGMEQSKKGKTKKLNPSLLAPEE